MGMKLHRKLESFPRIKTKGSEEAHTVRAVIVATHSKKDSLEADVGAAAAVNVDNVRGAVGWRPLARS